jgi:hypothetical protein
MTEIEKRSLVLQRAGFRCEYCQFPAAHLRHPMHVDHVRARQHGGADDIENLALSCSRCNLTQAPNIATIDPDGDGFSVLRLFNPRTDAWDNHFELVDGAIIGRTAIGRATVFLLNVNEPIRIEMRRALVELGQWPTSAKP